MDMYFLYFPEDKTEYIPAFIALVFFMILALAAMYFFYKRSKKDEQILDEKFEMHKQMSDHKNDSHQQ